MSSDIPATTAPSSDTPLEELSTSPGRNPRGRNSAPFIGLFGTVIGIMNAFLGIGRAGSASLAVVAPGIAEALVATAAGLAAAIPAVIASNYCNSRLGRLLERVEDFQIEYAETLRQAARRVD